MRYLFICAALMLLAACDGGQSPTAPTPERLATGTWQGTITTDAGLTGTMHLTLTQDASGAVRGMGDITLPSLSIANGSISGGLPPTATAPQAIGLSIGVGGPCPATLAAPATFTSRTDLAGVVAGGNPSCGLDLSGRFSLRKQG